LFDVVIEINRDEEIDSFMEDVGVACNEKNQNLRTIDGKQTLKRKIPSNYDR
jgi:hypothetical protein